MYSPREAFSDPLVLREEDAHYLTDVLRVSPGGEIETFDGEGGADRWEVAEITRRKIRLKHLGHSDVPRRSPVNLTLGLNPLKAGNEEFAVRMAAAMEVGQLLPVIFARSEIPLDEPALDKRMDRWRRLCVSEVALTGGANLPEIRQACLFGDAVTRSAGRRVLFFEGAQVGATVRPFAAGEQITAFIGPEGGLEPDEVDSARASGCEIASLGPWTLRAELAGALAPFWIYSHVEQTGKG